MKNIKIGLKWVHMARYELILRLEGALWLTIISGPLLTPKAGLPGWNVCVKSDECALLQLAAVLGAVTPMPAGGSHSKIGGLA